MNQMFRASCGVRSRRDRRRSSAFTLLEVMLAAVLAALMLGAVAGLFGAIGQSQKRQKARLENALEMATAHRTITNAMTSLIMTDQPLPREEELKQRKADDRRKAKEAAAGVGAEAPVAGGSTALGGMRPRLMLQPSFGEARVGGRAMQKMAMCLRTPPILGGYESADQDGLSAPFRDSAANDRARAKAERRAARKEGRGRESASSQNAPTGSGLGDAVQAALARAKGGGGDSSESSIPGLESVIEPARAVGLRGSFEILPDEPSGKVLTGLTTIGDGTTETGVALWWNEDGRDGSVGRRVKLLGGLRDAEWTAFRERGRDRQMSAIWAEELPAFMEFKFETLDGRREHWMFEMAWSTGPEPGEVVPTGADPLGRQDRRPQPPDPPNPVPEPDNGKKLQ